MTIREIVALVCDEQPLTDQLVRECLFAIAGGIRTMKQKEASTFEGDCSGVLDWIEEHGHPTVENFNEYLELPGILDYEIPDEAFFQWVQSEKGNE